MALPDGLQTLFEADIAKSLAAQNTLLLLDHRALSGLMAGNLLAGNAQAFNTSARIPVTLDQPGSVVGK